MPIGAALTSMALRHWRYRHEETVSVLEAAILKVGGGEPLPRTRLDRFLTYVQVVLGFILGPFFFLSGIVIIWVELGLL